MDKSRTKNYIIALLILVNIFLLTVYLLDRAEQETARREHRESLNEVFSSSGISLLVRPADLGATSYCHEVERDEDLERQIAETLIGDAGVQDQGGNIMRYEGQGGEAVFRSSGEFEILIHGGEPMGDDPVETAARILSGLGIQTAPDNVRVQVDADRRLSVTHTCYQQEQEVFNGKITVTFTDDAVSSVSGTRVLDNPSLAPGQESMDLGTLLIRFLENVKAEGAVLSRVTGLQQGYVQKVTVSGGGVLTPVLRITTDSGDFFVNGLTGEAENMFS